MDKSYEVTPEDCNEATKKYIFKLGSRHHYVLLLNTGFEAVGR
jgi:hypothetical protein